MNSNNEQLIKAFLSHPIYRACLFYIAPTAMAMLLGFSFFLIVQGLLSGFLWLAPYWPASFRSLKKILNFPGSGMNVTSIPIKWWRIPIILIKIAVSSAMVSVGIYILISRGFLDQNLIWLLLN
jgi:hypothetical protein